MGAMRKIISTSFFLVRIKLFFWAFMAIMNPVRVSASTSMINVTNIAKPGCSSKCGNVTIPYPFGFGDRSCSLDSNYYVYCDVTYDPPIPYIRGYRDVGLEILSISETKLRIRNEVAVKCYNSSGGVTNDFLDWAVMYGFPSGSPFSFSYDSNRVTTIGCSVQGQVSASLFDDNPLGSTSCNTKCPSKEKVVGSRCGGVGCCQEVIPKGMRIALVGVNDIVNVSEFWCFNRCSYAFLAEEGTFTFKGLPDFNDPNFSNKTVDHVPVVVDWVIGNQTCEELQNQSDGSYACQANTTCVDYFVNSIGGYTCSCLPGYQGNPYLSPGCSDIAVAFQVTRGIRISRLVVQTLTSVLESTIVPPLPQPTRKLLVLLSSRT